ncbi:hypothetical protein GV67_07210 [Pseudorhizobium pelagicum]|uniref:Uncharacterized protein n=1 Tax=Pseudorhizobium pelagicum TaxID=1509405 RepID=A0A922P099_9HYPH|nr:hypothetical protein GV68_19490 [Pseudorhizobium pelagicum]KEQ04888.1 hypothetical protein GV67_07210 [Pseudorhizobium pelagicum]
MVLSRALLAAALIAAMGHTARAEPSPPDSALITAQVLQEINDWINTDIVRVSIVAQNKRYDHPGAASIAALDSQWVKERENPDKPLIAATLSNPLSVYLSRMQGKSLGLYPEIFVMDQNGLNVGQSSITSDFWQGDEDKFLKTFEVSADAVFIDEAEYDSEFGIWRTQVSMTVNDADGGQKIGAVTVELNLTELERRAASGT